MPLNYFATPEDVPAPGTCLTVPPPKYGPERFGITSFQYHLLTVLILKSQYYYLNKLRYCELCKCINRWIIGPFHFLRDDNSVRSQNCLFVNRWLCVLVKTHLNIILNHLNFRINILYLVFFVFTLLNQN